MFKMCKFTIQGTFLVAAQTSSTLGYALVSSLLPTGEHLVKATLNPLQTSHPCPGSVVSAGFDCNCLPEAPWHASLIQEYTFFFSPIVTLFRACVLSSKGIPKTAFQFLH